MLKKPLKSIDKFITDITDESDLNLSNTQRFFIGMLLTSMVLLGTFNISKFAYLFCLSPVSKESMYKMLARSSIPYRELLFSAIKLIFRIFGITEISIVIDDTYRERSKGCKALSFIRKSICKLTGGWIQAQNIVFILFVTNKVTMPIWFQFHTPAKLTKEQKKQVKKDPKKVFQFDANYKTTIDLAIEGLHKVASLINKLEHELQIKIKITCVSGDNGFSSPKVQQAVVNIFHCQFISKLNPSQLVKTKTGHINLTTYFARVKSQTRTIRMRGRLITLEMKAHRVNVKSFGRKVFVIAIRYQKSDEWQFLFGTDLSWTAVSIIKGYALRWLIEVFFEDWKQFDGWGEGALQQDDDGIFRGVYLSLLVDLFLIYQQQTCETLQEHGRGQLYSAGTVVRHLQVEAFTESVDAILSTDDPKKELDRVSLQMKDLATRHLSLKHTKELFGMDELGPSKHLVSIFTDRNRAEEKMQRNFLNSLAQAG